MVKQHTFRRVAFARDLAAGKWTLAELAERYEVHLNTAWRWKKSPWCMKLQQRLGEYAIKCARSAMQNQAEQSVRNLARIANMEIGPDDRGLETVRKANRDFLEAIGVLGPEGAATASVQNVEYITVINEAGALETTVVASGADASLPASRGNGRALPRPGNGNEVG